MGPLGLASISASSRAFSFDLPSLSEQAEIVRRIKTAFAEIDRLAAEAAAAGACWTGWTRPRSLRPSAAIGPSRLCRRARRRPPRTHPRGTRRRSGLRAAGP